MSVYAVVLAAGASSRYGTEPPKQVELLPQVLAALRESSVDEIVVVSGAHALPVESVPCADWERGPGASLRCGLATLPPEVEAAVVVLADGPDLDPRAVDRVVDDWRDERRRRRRRDATAASASIRSCSRGRCGTTSPTRARSRSRPGSSRATTCAPPGDVDCPSPAGS